MLNTASSLARPSGKRVDDERGYFQIVVLGSDRFFAAINSTCATPRTLDRQQRLFGSGVLPSSLSFKKAWGFNHRILGFMPCTAAVLINFVFQQS